MKNAINVSEGIVTENYKRFASIIFIIIAFIFLVTFVSFYIKEYSPGFCYCGLPLWVIVLVISSSGLFIGGFVYYLFNKDHIKEKNKIVKGIKKTLCFLEREEKNIITALIEHSGEITQKNLSDQTGFNKVKISRVINKLEVKGLIKKMKYGMTNKIVLNEDLKNLFEKVTVSKSETNV